MSLRGVPGSGAHAASCPLVEAADRRRAGRGQRGHRPGAHRRRPPLVRPAPASRAAPRSRPSLATGDGPRPGPARAAAERRHPPGPQPRAVLEQRVAGLLRIEGTGMGRRRGAHGRRAIPGARSAHAIGARHVRKGRACRWGARPRRGRYRGRNRARHEGCAPPGAGTYRPTHPCRRRSVHLHDRSRPASAVGPDGLGCRAAVGRGTGRGGVRPDGARRGSRGHPGEHSRDPMPLRALPRRSRPTRHRADGVGLSAVDLLGPGTTASSPTCSAKRCWGESPSRGSRVADQPPAWRKRSGARAPRTTHPNGRRCGPRRRRSPSRAESETEQHPTQGGASAPPSASGEWC